MTTFRISLLAAIVLAATIPSSASAQLSPAIDGYSTATATPTSVPVLAPLPLATSAPALSGSTVAVVSDETLPADSVTIQLMQDEFVNAYVSAPVVDICRCKCEAEKFNAPSYKLTSNQGPYGPGNLTDYNFDYERISDENTCAAKNGKKCEGYWHAPATGTPADDKDKGTKMEGKFLDCGIIAVPRASLSTSSAL